MLTKNDLIESFLNEGRICIHLFERIPEGGLDYRPTPGQRSTLELLRYLTFHVTTSTYSMITGNWDNYRLLMDEAHKMEAVDFPKAMGKQM
jgi:hypothetical protein